ncbi:hypothetical protein ACFXKD_27635 [Nocardiopsis aegyptia]|uniref:hypothetical protein n=1 Tax=Nocardiopsis aegyptia TaxID=220378 RepID=UPI003670BECC
MSTPHPLPTSGLYAIRALRAVDTARTLSAHLIRGCCCQQYAAHIDDLAAAAIADLTEFRVEFRAERADLDTTHLTPSHITGGHHG